MVDIEKKSSARIRIIASISIVTMLVFAWMIFDQIAKAERVARDEALNNNSRLLRIMSQQIELAFIGVDNALHRAVENRAYNMHTNTASTETMQNVLHSLVMQSPRLAAIMMVDANGTPVTAVYKKRYEDWLDYNHYLFTNNELFLRLRKGDDKRFYIGTLPANKKEIPDFIIMGRRITNPDGTFGGAFISAIDSGFFINYFKTVEKGSRSYLSLQMIDSESLLTDGPVQGAYYEDINKLALAKYKSSPETTEPSVNTYGINFDVEIYGFTKLRELPVLLTIALADKDYLQGWRETRFKDFCFLIIFIMFGSLLSYFAIATARQIIQVEKSEAAAVLASQAKSEFLANMSHELRTPLNAIIGFSEMMNSGYFGQLNPKQKERIHDINLCGSHLLNLITDILEFSKGDAGKLELNEERVVMRDIVSEALRIVNKKVKEKQMNIITEIYEGLPDILGDKRKIRQILLNLLSNSVKFTSENGTIKISINQDTGKNVVMTVSDTGIGISEQDIPVALSVFGQVHRNQSHEGTGLGLPLCKMFAELHGGKLALGSVIDEGTTVRITFPAFRNIG